MKFDKKPLWRKVNTRARGVHHNTGGDAKNDRNTKNGLSKSMKQGKQRGLDYTPLYKFLLSKVGQSWDEIYSEAKARLQGVDTDAIFHIVSLEPDEKDFKWGYSLCGESSRYSILTVDENGILQILMPNLKNENLFPSCHCCTHTFNGKPLVNKYVP